MDRDGGVGYMLKCIASKLDPFHRLSLVARRRRAAFEKLHSILQQCAPASEAANLCADMQAVSQVKEKRLTPSQDRFTTAVAEVEMSWLLRQLIGVDPDVLDPLPRNPGEADCFEYVRQQLGRWLDSKERLWRGRPEVDGTRPGAWNRLLAHLAASADIDSVAAWLHDNLSRQLSREDRMELRLPLSFSLSRAILRRDDEVGRGGEAESSRNSVGTAAINRMGVAHRSQIIDPIFKALAEAISSSATARPSLSGDEELEAILQTIRQQIIPAGARSDDKSFNRKSD